MDKKKLARQIRRSARVLASVGYRCSLGPEPFHLIAIGSTDVCLVHIAENWPPRPWIVDELQQFATPASTKKLIHHWRKRSRLPGAIVIG